MHSGTGCRCYVLGCRASGCRASGCRASGCRVSGCYVLGCRVSGCYVCGCKVSGVFLPWVFFPCLLDLGSFFQPCWILGLISYWSCWCGGNDRANHWHATAWVTIHTLRRVVVVHALLNTLACYCLDPRTEKSTSGPCLTKHVAGPAHAHFGFLLVTLPAGRSPTYTRCKRGPNPKP